MSHRKPHPVIQSSHPLTIVCSSNLRGKLMQGVALPQKQLEVRLAENQLEIEQTLALRYEVFNQELGEGLPESAATCKDRDEYDLYCDHLIVVDRAANNRIAGTYRLLRGSVARAGIGFYSDNEFDLSAIYEQKDETAEIGRSCVHPDYRDGSVIGLLWTGLGWYIKKHNIRYLMGCGSVHDTSVETANDAFAFFREKGHLVDGNLRVTPLASHRMPGFDPEHRPENLKAAMWKIPPLLHGYTKVGAKIGGEPALDSVFGTTDFFIFFDSRKISDRYEKHYLRD